MITGLDHVQINAPAGHETAARAFFGDFLGLPELLKPESLRASGGVWFGLPDGRQIHTGVAEPFVPSSKGHPCLRTHDLEAVLRRCEACGVACWLDHRLSTPRLYVNDPWGNRLEIVQGQHEAVTLP
ncbi:catechol 2,3-dioxygenase-like lactoylglutathione lyase family enzyme [Deinobacterium chartae]|uniref:Catechol 2,3-dioxygenase-like lactoylglutathione lyase family enzyme n=1 Tax=Deinobacterium chartae TaxID=521158 RepID=A0A841HVR0_9DEIO|nr:catechol 2,3-dioxygenase-like lactoylglutathione lyase family enzyme [Deinobacterium chartae]